MRLLHVLLAIEQWAVRKWHRSAAELKHGRSLLESVCLKLHETARPDSWFAATRFDISREDAEALIAYCRYCSDES